MRMLGRAAIVVVLCTAVFGLAYPALLTALASMAFSKQAGGSLVVRNGSVVGSRLAAQGFTGARWFHERPSATAPAYNAGATTFSNLGPRSPDLAKLIARNANAVLALERPYNPGLTIHDIPVDAVTPSGSGIDPDITPAYARLQARRIAAARQLALATVQRLIAQNTDGRSLGFLGEPGVNVLELNLALDRLGGA
jgi:K+-transporting ATPase ATPase C chain